MFNLFTTTNKRERGQSLVEIAISFPVLLIIISGLIDLGRVYYVYIGLEDAAAEGALYLSIDPACMRDTDTRADSSSCADPNNAVWRTINANPQQIDLTAPGVTVDAFRPGTDTGEGYGIGDVTRVRITYPFEFITPGIRLITDEMLINVEATNVIIQDR